MSTEQQGTSLAIDGLWSLYSPWNTGEVLRVADGYVFFPKGTTVQYGGQYLLPPNAIVGKNLQQVGPREYQCDWAVFTPTNGKAIPIESFAPTKIEVATDRSLTISVLSESGFYTFNTKRFPYHPMLSGGEKILVRAEPNPQSITQGISPDLKANSPVKTIFAPTIEYRLTNTDEFEVTRGAQVRIDHTEETQREVSVGTDIAIQGSLSLDILAWLKAAIEVEVQQRSGSVSRSSKGSKRELMLDGNIATIYRVEWFDRIQKGTVAFQVNGSKPMELPFEVKEGEYVRVTPLDKVKLR